MSLWVGDQHKQRTVDQHKDEDEYKKTAIHIVLGPGQWRN